MPFESNVDSFIESSLKLLAAFPSSTTLSITYSNELKKREKKSKATTDHDNKKATNSVTFKCYEPQSGKCIKYKTYKVKELSRLLTFIGPRGVSITKSRKRQNDDNDNAVTSKKSKIEHITEHTVGLASIMSNVKFENEEPNSGDASKLGTPGVEETVDAAGSTISPSNATQLPISGSSKNKKKKKKGKK